MESKAYTMLGWHGLRLESLRPIQSLWAGYGHICTVVASPASQDADYDMHDCHGYFTDSDSLYPLILKLISPPPMDTAQENESHLRKMLSYEVEQYFYTQVAPHLPGDVAVAGCVSSTWDMAGR